MKQYVIETDMDMSAIRELTWQGFVIRPVAEAVPVSLIEEHIHSYDRQANAARRSSAPEDWEDAVSFDDRAWALRYVLQDWRDRNAETD